LQPMKQSFLKLMSLTLTLVLSGIIMLQGFQLSARYKKSAAKVFYKTEKNFSNLIFSTSESEHEKSVLYWLKNGLKICPGNSSNSESENEEEETREIETDELCNLQGKLSIFIALDDALLKDLLSVKLPNPYLLHSSPPPEA
jgi:hypothetical protein